MDLGTPMTLSWKVSRNFLTLSKKDTGKWIVDVKYIDKATFPVIKIVSSREYLYKKIDITIKELSTNRHHGEECVELVL